MFCPNSDPLLVELCLKVSKAKRHHHFDWKRSHLWVTPLGVTVRGLPERFEQGIHTQNVPCTAPRFRAEHQDSSLLLSHLGGRCSQLLHTHLHDFSALADCIPSNHEPRELLLFSSCFCEILFHNIVMRKLTRTVLEPNF